MSDSDNFKDGAIDFAAGSLGGVALVYVGQPLDTIKVKMQTFPNLYSNMFQCFIKTLRNDGVLKGLYAGTLPALVTNVAENSVLFLCYGFCQKFMQKITGTENTKDLSVVNKATAGFLASFFSSLAITPTELIKCKLQAMHEINKQKIAMGHKPEHVGSLKLTSNILKNEGFSGLFRGFLPTVAREMPGYFFFFGGYEGMRELLREPGQDRENIGLLKTMMAGSVGGIIFWVLMYPIDVAKSRIQVSSLDENMVTLTYRIFRNEGVAALYNGLTPTLIRTIPSTAALFATYEYSKTGMHFILRDF